MLAWQHNPISTQTKQRIGIGVTLLLGVAAVYFGLKPSTSVPSTITIQAGPQAVTIPATGLTLTLPPNATWITGGVAGTSTPLFFAGTAFAPGTGTFPLTWSLNGATQTTNLTVTAVI